MIDDELEYSKNEKKLELGFDSVRKKYNEGKKVLQKEEEKMKKQEMEAKFEISIFGKKLSAYLMQDRNLKPGPQMGKSVGKIKGIISENKDLSSEELKNLIDTTEL